MTDTMKIRLINAYANLLDVFARSNNELKENMRSLNSYRSDYNNICEAINHLSEEIQNIKVNDEIRKGSKDE